jgi:hypothetical protein
MNRQEIDKLVQDLTDMFLERWGIGLPPPAYTEQWKQDQDVLQWAHGLRRRYR